jgi:hypothetical protein
MTEDRPTTPAPETADEMEALVARAIFDGLNSPLAGDYPNYVSRTSALASRTVIDGKFLLIGVARCVLDDLWKAGLLAVPR